MPTVSEPLSSMPTSGVISTRSVSAEGHLQLDHASSSGRSTRHSRPPPSADVSASFEASFVSKIDPRLLEERTLVQRLRPAIALLSAAILVAIFDPVYAAATGEVLEIIGQRLSLFAGALLLLAIGLAAREFTREQ
jgi:hypothetical protein